MSTISPADFDLLSAWLDDQLSPEERAALEARLDVEPALQAALGDLRALVAELHALPDLRAPRDMRLTAAQLRPVKRTALFPAFVSSVSGLAAAVLLIAGLGLLRSPAPSAVPVSGDQAIAAAPTAAATAPPSETASMRQMEIAPMPTNGHGAGAESTVEDALANDVMALQSGGAVDQEQADFGQVNGAAAPAADLPTTEEQAAASEALADALMYAPPAATFGPQSAQTATNAAVMRTKEETPAASPGAAPAIALTPLSLLSTRPAPSTPQPVAPALEQAQTPADVRGASVSLDGIALIGGGIVMLGISLAVWRRARRNR